LKDGSVGECAEQVICERAWVMAKEKAKGEEARLVSRPWRMRNRRWIITSII